MQKKVISNSRTGLAYLICFSSIFLCGCYDNNSKSHSKSEHKNTNNCNANSLTKLDRFADTLSLDTGKLLNNYFNERYFSLKGCDLKMLRNNFKVKSSIVLIICKLNDYYLRSGYKDVIFPTLSDISETSDKITHEYIYLVYKNDLAFNENLRTSDIKKVILEDKRLLGVPNIKELYNKSLELEKKANKRFKF